MASMIELNRLPHRRFNPLTSEWVLVSPNRTQRPWVGQVEKKETVSQLAYEPNCYLCPGNLRSGGFRNPQYDSTFFFDNDFPALAPQSSSEKINRQDLLVARAEPGLCRVMCFSPRHDLTIASMETTELTKVVDCWADQVADLGSRKHIRYVQIFENRGAMMGISNLHPHCQIWATGSVPNEPYKEQRASKGYVRKHGKCLLCEYLSLELLAQERVIAGNEHFTVLVPFWAVWPFETMVLPRRHVTDLAALTSPERRSLAQILKTLVQAYDRVFDHPFPYSMGFHQRPTDGEAHEEWHMHVHLYPPLLRSATVRKFMAGFEMFGSPLRDLTPEVAAARLRDLCDSALRSGAGTDRS
jgi:UDPglucose--hexose-1-phosphate uridylyltransferase